MSRPELTFPAVDNQAIRKVRNTIDQWNDENVAEIQHARQPLLIGRHGDLIQVEKNVRTCYPAPATPSANRKSVLPAGSVTISLAVVAAAGVLATDKTFRPRRGPYLLET